VFGVQKKLARASLALNGIIKTRQLHLSKSVKEFEGLDIEGLGTGLNGVSVTSGKEVYIIRCAIRHFTGNGVNLAGSTNAGHAFINDSSIAFNAGGVNVQGTANIASITNSSILSNTSFAVRANGASNIVGVQTSVLDNSSTGISLLAGGTAISVGPSNLVTVHFPRRFFSSKPRSRTSRQDSRRAVPD
jgi:hypothetical protein